LRIALRGAAEYYEEYNYNDFLPNLNQMIENIVSRREIDVIFMQIQRAGVIDIGLMSRLKKSGVKIFNFTGDVRQPLPQWYIDLAPHVVTLFTNDTDVQVLRKLGCEAYYFQIGYNQEYYHTGVAANSFAPPIVFFGNNYGDMFPLSGLRREMVQSLQKRYGSLFQVYGSGWSGGINLMGKQLDEAAIYRGCKIAISLSHFNLSRYSSDRLLRILGCGAFCLSHRYPDAEEEFFDNEDLVYWDNLKDLHSKIDFYLSDDLSIVRKRIAEIGNKKVETFYTWQYRINNQLIELI
jgi:hypothetical protein